MKKNILYISSMMLIATLLGSYLYISAFPEMARSLETSSQNIKLSLTIYIISYAISQVVSGPASNQIGQFRIAKIGLSIYIMGTCLLIILPSINILLFSRVIQGIGAGCLAVISRVLLRTYSDTAHLSRNIAFLNIISELIPLLSPLIGSQLAHIFGWQGIFIFILLYLVLLFIILKNKTEPSSNSPFSLKKILIEYSTCLYSRSFISLSSIAALMYTCGLLEMTLAPFLLQDNFLLSITSYGYIMLFPPAGFILGSAISSMLKRNTQFITGIVLTFVSSLICYHTVSVAGVVIFFTLIQTSGGFVFTSITTELLNKFSNLAGTAVGLFYFIMPITSSLLTQVVAYITNITLKELGVIYFTIALIMMLLGNLAFDSNKTNIETSTTE